MADPTLLTRCPACDAAMSRQALACRACGHPNAPASRRALVPLLVAIAVMLALLAWRFASLRG